MWGVGGGGSVHGGLTTGVGLMVVVWQPAALHGQPISASECACEKPGKCTAWSSVGCLLLLLLLRLRLRLHARAAAAAAAAATAAASYYMCGKCTSQCAAASVRSSRFSFAHARTSSAPRVGEQYR